MSAPTSPHDTDDAHRHFLPGMGRDFLLPLYDPLSRLLRFERHHRELLERARLLPGQRVVEIGCGTGNLALLAKRLGPDADVVGIDPDTRALARARRKAERHGLDVGFDHGFAQDLPYDDASFDAVLSAFMLHHLDPETKQAALREARRVLAPEGALLLVDFGAAAGQAGGLGARFQGPSGEQQPGHPAGGVTGLLRSAGFAEPAVTSHRIRFLGSISSYRATVSPTSEQGG
jgi:ubiquinone/menaquinone biosynthesis C-methylase UbiE